MLWLRCFTHSCLVNRRENAGVPHVLNLLLLTFTLREMYSLMRTCYNWHQLVDRNLTERWTPYIDSGQLEMDLRNSKEDSSYIGFISESLFPGTSFILIKLLTFAKFLIFVACL